MLSLQDIQAAKQRLEGIIKKTPLHFVERLSEQFGAEVYVKREDLQSVRSFKIRGAYNKISQLTDQEKKRGVVCASAGNHAQGVAYSANTLGVKATIFMPLVTPQQKIRRVKHFGGKYTDIKLVGNTFDESSREASRFAKENNAVFVHAFNDFDVIAGQGTIGLEILEELPDVDMIFVPVGGGGIVSGISLAATSLSDSVQVYGVESDTQDSMAKSLSKGIPISYDSISTFADGTAVGIPGENTFEMVKKYVKKIVHTSDGEVATQMIDLYQNEGIIAEPSGAISISGIVSNPDLIRGKKIVCVISGGNNDILRYPDIMERSLVHKGLKHYFIIKFAQKPGQLKGFLENALGPNDDIVRFEYIKKNNREEGPAFVGIELSAKKDIVPLVERMDAMGLHYEKVDSGDMLYQYLV